MPIYEYGCPRGHHFELIRPMSESAVPANCECGELADRVPSGARTFMRYDATQTARPKKPGMDNCQNDNRRVPAGGAHRYDPGAD
jgi:putative FmdB family regulatory protein